MTDYKVEFKERIKLKERVISTVRKVDNFLNKLIQLFLSFVPEWFKLMSWLVISGAILYVYSKYRLYGFDILFSFSLLFLLFYILFFIRKKLSFLNRYTKKYLLLDLFVSTFFIILPIALFIFLLYAILGLSLP